VAVEDLVGDAAAGLAVNESEGLRPVPFDLHDGHRRVRENAPDAGVGLEVFELHPLPLRIRLNSCAFLSCRFPVLVGVYDAIKPPEVAADSRRRSVVGRRVSPLSPSRGGISS
jgi:hypothetical protein